MAVGTVLELNFEPVHRIENNSESQLHLDEHRSDFNRSCYDVFKALADGHELTTDNAKQLAGTRSLPRRIMDLRQPSDQGVGFKITEEWVKNEDGKRLYKKWYMTAEDKAFNFKAILSRTQKKH